MMGLGRTGSAASNGSGDYVVSFSTAASVRRLAATRTLETSELSNGEMDALFQAVVETTEEAIYNSLFAATTMSSRGGTVEALPLDRVREILGRYGVRPGGR
jgi:D-aminopeptidase